eukprot:CAMPEP_0201281716 /NCGR_PEP_ID=MMETSP1317-20130820/3895_1 /ASSEMBLY_ACC=CAM_ASM_000770 /TAXON_ID=187299 /ORGANISM="Undescribed Undescribed, Strain Undescribed" /LENGTH=77 /DNA_ID=CAMNT_0047592419 /DNA_START=568 /DNA_END=801 /DNA_ORIENTATION=-
MAKELVNIFGLIKKNIVDIYSMISLVVGELRNMLMEISILENGFMIPEKALELWKKPLEKFMKVSDIMIKNLDGVNN